MNTLAAIAAVTGAVIACACLVLLADLERRLIALERRPEPSGRLCVEPRPATWQGAKGWVLDVRPCPQGPVT